MLTLTYTLELCNLSTVAFPRDFVCLFVCFKSFVCLFVVFCFFVGFI